MTHATPCPSATAAATINHNPPADQPPGSAQELENLHLEAAEQKPVDDDQQDHGEYRRYVEAARLINPAARFVGVSANTSKLALPDRRRYLGELEERLGLPCVDPVATSVAPILDLMLETGAQAPAPAMG